MTAKAMVEWIRDNVPEDGRSKDPLEAACWFCAWHDAESMLDGLRTKDLARMIQGGERLGPMSTEAHVQTWLDQNNDASAEEWDGEQEPIISETKQGEIDEDLIEKMKTFWL